MHPYADVWQHTASTTGATDPHAAEETAQRSKDRYRRYLYISASKKKVTPVRWIILGVRKKQPRPALRIPRLGGTWPLKGGTRLTDSSVSKNIVPLCRACFSLLNSFTHNFNTFTQLEGLVWREPVRETVRLFSSSLPQQPASSGHSTGKQLQFKPALDRWRRLFSLNISSFFSTRHLSKLKFKSTHASHTMQHTCQT